MATKLTEQERYEREAAREERERQLNEAKVAWATQGMTVHLEEGSVDVPSWTHQGVYHHVPFDHNFYATECPCESSIDCYHLLAVDRFFDGYPGSTRKHPSFYELLDCEPIFSPERRAQRSGARAAREGAVRAAAAYLATERALGTERGYAIGTCGHLVKGGHEWADCGCQA